MSFSFFGRILAAIILLLSVLFMPFWVSAILALAGMIYFPFFLEAVLVFLLSDLLYGTPLSKPFNIVFVSFILTLACFIILELLKKKLRFNK
ncbi:hypothetical protein A2917_01285 [Candidatus Nomurabacteria bacterium RIFCSPLOWO2_01_FULL_42_17]|uniref:Uncharacterized protein n=1 Tax=Candidatus Nomurabacteria bacterium RIFCSPLOWO2_01_FULL_42_17 TaxID=1801780 RepID=A0A1F6XLW4_9BACT|nr:MAG: hypothetical protein A2917_01285 [Candidatus Nomurabacteria bacterium RIFCSPLOWO2_01_FULL_42_17]